MTLSGSLPTPPRSQPIRLFGQLELPIELRDTIMFNGLHSEESSNSIGCMFHTYVFQLAIDFVGILYLHEFLLWLKFCAFRF